MQSAEHVAIVGTGDDATVRIAAGLGDRATRIALDAAFDQSRWPALQGPHNAHNAAAAIATARALGIDDDAIEQALASFTGLPHRMERVATLGGVTWYDDSKATNPESAAPALAAFPRVHWIVGGRAKGDDLDACLPHLAHVARAYTIGEAGPRFAGVLRPHVPVAEVETLERAVKLAAQEAVRGEVVLLSPAAASFDQFRDYEHRGRAFREAVEALA
jgi:UDP-N-acetylmuramoylalanine--D-glutamate ligase